MFIVKNRIIFFILSAVLVIGSFVAMYSYGFNFGIDFKGGSLTEVRYLDARPAVEQVKSDLSTVDLGSYIISPSGDTNYIIKSRELNQDEKGFVIRALSHNGEVGLKEERFNSIGPAVGNELKQKAFTAIAVVILCIVLFITFAFRKVSFPVASWKYGVATIIALAHDVIIPAGVFVAWCHFKGGEVDLLFVTALLAILGYSVHDTIVVFDRVRENLHGGHSSKTTETFEETVGKSVTQTFGRSINTSLTIFLALVALYFIGGETTRNFAFVLLVGVIAGTYSSIFVASPLLVVLEGKNSSKK